MMNIWRIWLRSGDGRKWIKSHAPNTVCAVQLEAYIDELPNLLDMFMTKSPTWERLKDKSKNRLLLRGACQTEEET